jgi:hypothetical protein
MRRWPRTPLFVLVEYLLALLLVGLTTLTLQLLGSVPGAQIPTVGYLLPVVASALEPSETLTIVVPQFIPRHWWGGLLHTQAAAMLRDALMHKPGIVITSVPYQID